MKKYSLLLTLLLAVWTFQACNTNTNSEDSVDSAKDMNEMKDSDDNTMGDTTAAMQGTMAVSEDDSKFMVNTADGGMTEVEASKVAQQKATNANVKAFADMMVTDHTKANDELKALAGMKNVTLPATVGDNHRNDIDDLSKKTGKDFDKAYINMMVSDHKKTVDDFEDCSKMDKVDPDLKAWVDKTLPTLRQHLDKAKSLDDQLKK